MSVYIRSPGIERKVDASSGLSGASSGDIGDGRKRWLQREVMIRERWSWLYFETLEREKRKREYRYEKD